MVLHKNRGTEFDDHFVEFFIRTLCVYPVGSVVELNNKEVAVVYEPNVENSRKPTLGILTQSNGKKRAAPLVCNLALCSEAEGREVSKVLDPEKVDVDVDEVMEQIKTRGEHSDRLRR